MEPSTTIRLRAPAKVNLSLHVLAKRADGYHDLKTRMQKLDICDEITLLKRDRPGIGLSCPDPEVPEDETNLVWKAADIFFKSVSGVQLPGVDIVLKKNIPVAAGLGGGSSDAGTVLKGLNEFFKTKKTPDELIEIGRTLGADVPFFVVDDSAVVATGIGDRMSAVEPLEEYFFLLVNPGFSVSTRWVYENYTLTTVDKTYKDAGFEKKLAPFHIDQLHNDLERVTVKRYPVIDEIKKTLLELGADSALMSGSGPTVFGIFKRDNISKTRLAGEATRLRQLFGDKIYIAKCAGAWPSGEGTGF